MGIFLVMAGIGKSNSSLLAFPKPPRQGFVTVEEREGQFLYASLDEQVIPGNEMVCFELFIESNSRDTSTSFSVPFTNQSAFYPVQEHRLKTAFHTWRDSGTVKMLEQLSEEEEQDDIGERLTQTATSLLNCLRKLQTFYSWITFAPVQIHHEEICQNYAPISDWSKSLLRGISVHPRLSILAVARQNDVIEVRDMRTNNLNILLEDRSQKCISCLKWAFHSNTLLAVGVLGGVVLWHVDTAHPTTRAVCSTLNCFTSQPIISLSWCPQGRLLACATPTDSTLLIWDIPLRISTKLQRVQGGGISSVNWSSSGNRLFVSHINALCRVWETTQWTCEKWTNLAGRCKASCWSPNGQYLMFAMEGDPSLYYLNFPTNDTVVGSDMSAAVKCADLSECCLGEDKDDEDAWTGGLVQSLAWDKAGERLAVLFSITSAGANRVVVFRTQCYPVLELLPGGFIQGREGDIPVWVEFASCFEKTSVLVTGWDNGRISFTPMVYSLSRRVPNDLTTLTNDTPIFHQLNATPSLYTQLL